jgi:hypothetical protein
MKSAFLKNTVGAALAIPIAICAAIVQQATTIQAQSPPATVPKWEVVSVKTCKNDPSEEQRPADSLANSPNTIRLSCLPVRQLILTAYVFFAGGHLTGNHPNTVKIQQLPGWTDSERYTVYAKAAALPVSR